MDIEHSVSARPVDKGRDSSKRRWLIWVAAGLAALLLVAFGLMQWRMSYVPADLDYSTVRLTEQGLFEVGYTPDQTPIPVNQIHSWTLHVETAAGEPVVDADILVGGDMPQHGHGLPTQPQVTGYLGDGDYLLEGVKFQMGGWWVMDFTIHSGDQTDTVRFNFVLD